MSLIHSLCCIRPDSNTQQPTPEMRISCHSECGCTDEIGPVVMGQHCSLHGDCVHDEAHMCTVLQYLEVSSFYDSCSHFCHFRYSEFVRVLYFSTTANCRMV